MAEEIVKPDFELMLLQKPPDHPRGQHRMPAKIEEIILGRHLRRAKIRPELGQNERACIGLRAVG